ncbi:MAG: D-alanyl-D-alanine carboxypeptidase family protein [Candidatus Obscuribacter sp.]|nr:D-alanyl-D-alanine carboxypeptidase family protein [Candidatus Obscuribacter sp.]
MVKTTPAISNKSSILFVAATDNLNYYHDRSMISFLPFIVSLILLTCATSASASTIDLRAERLPAASHVKAGLTAGSYHNEPVDINDVRGGEALIDLKDQGIACDNFYARKDQLNAPYYRAFKSAPTSARLRQGVVLKLVQVNQLLKPYGVELLVLDGYRPVSLQRELWQYFINQAKKVRPALTSAEQITYASHYCSNPQKYNESDSRTWPTHATGAAVDLTLKQLGSDSQLYMGGIFDDDSKISHTAYYESVKDSSTSALEARRNRRLLYWAMQKAGFSNYPYEWWHYDYGNQLWLLNQKKNKLISPKAKAWYGLARDSEN